MKYAIESGQLVKKYNGRYVLDQVTLNVPRGSIFGFIGPNGAGKTTTIRLLLGLAKPDNGWSRVLGLDSQKDSIKLRSKVGYVAEENHFFPWMRVKELLRFSAGFYNNWDNKRAKDLVDNFKLPLDDKVKELSKGMRTQLALTLALAHRPELLILDEPTSGLDPVWRRQFIQTLAKETASSGTTVFFSSHILSDVERVADWLAIIVEGKIKFTRPLDELKFNKRIVRVVFQSSPPQSLLEMPGIEAVKTQGRGYLLAISDNFSAIYSALQQTPHFALEVVEQDLESIFLDYACEEGENHAPDSI